METINILQHNPAIENDVSLFKIALTPLELFVFKIFLRGKEPTTIGLIYSELMVTIGNAIFFREQKDAQGDFVNNLTNTEYLSVLVNEGTLKGIAEEIRKLKETKLMLSFTNLSRFYQIKLKSLNCKFPSYDKIKGIVEKLVKLGVLCFRNVEGRKIIYTINPPFHNKFKNKYEEILKL